MMKLKNHPSHEPESRIDIHQTDDRSDFFTTDFSATRLRDFGKTPGA